MPAARACSSTVEPGSAPGLRSSAFQAVVEVEAGAALGHQPLVAGDFDAAVALFAREVKRSPYNDEFRFWLGIAHLKLGHLGDAREHIALAVDHSTRGDMREVYSAKLAHLRRVATTGTRLR